MANPALTPALIDGTDVTDGEVTEDRSPFDGRVVGPSAEHEPNARGEWCQAVFTAARNARHCEQSRVVEHFDQQVVGRSGWDDEGAVGMRPQDILTVDRESRDAQRRAERRLASKALQAKRRRLPRRVRDHQLLAFARAHELDRGTAHAAVCRRELRPCDVLTRIEDLDPELAAGVRDRARRVELTGDERQGDALAPQVHGRLRARCAVPVLHGAERARARQLLEALCSSRRCEEEQRAAKRDV